MAILESGDSAKSANISKTGPGEVIIHLSDGDGGRKLGRDDILAASTELPNLRKELEAWSTQVRGQLQS